MSVSTPPDDQLNPQFAKLELQGVSTIFNSVSGFSISWDVTPQATGTTTTGEPATAYRSGPPNYGDLTCQAQLITTDSSLFDWWDEIAKGVLTPKDGTLMLMTPASAPTATFKIVGAVMSSLEVTAMSLSSPQSAGLTAVLNCLSYSRMS